MTTHSTTLVNLSVTIDPSLFEIYIVDASAGGLTLTLPPATSDGIFVTIKRRDVIPLNLVTIVGNTPLTELIDGVSPLMLNIGVKNSLVSLSGQWYSV